MRTLTGLLFLLIIVTGCNAPKPSDQEDANGTDASGVATFELVELWRTDTVLTTCESVLFDGSRGILFVSCINGVPSDKDGKGFIARVDPSGNVASLMWVTGLNAPKGMGIAGNLLYVTDIDQLVIIDIDRAEVVERIAVEGASFLNDISVGPDGKIYVSDSDTGILWTYENGEMKSWITEGLERPNGLCVEESRVLLTSSGSQDLKVIDRVTGSMETVTTGIGQGDGIEFTGEPGYYITSSWAGEVFLVFPDFSKVSLLRTSELGINSADIGFNRDSRVVYVPTFYDNRVVAYRLEKKGGDPIGEAPGRAL